MKRAWFALLLSTLVSGCHVIDRAERCGRLSSIVKKAAPEIARVALPDSPPAASLKKKARLYGHLAQDLDKVHFNDQSVEAEKKALFLSFLNLERHLLEAAQAVEAQERFIERQGRMMERHRSPPPHSARYSPHTYGYERAKRAAEAASRAVETASRNLEGFCR